MYRIKHSSYNKRKSDDYRYDEINHLIVPVPIKKFTDFAIRATITDIENDNKRRCVKEICLSMGRI